MLAAKKIVKKASAKKSSIKIEGSKIIMTRTISGQEVREEFIPQWG